MATAAQHFDGLRDRYYQAWFRYHPENAVEAGVPGYAHLLTPYTDDDIGALMALNGKLLDGLEELDVEALDADRRIDADLMVGAAVLEMQALSDHDWRFRDPQRYLPLNAVYQLIVRDVEDFAPALLGRLRAVPAHLRNARQYLDKEPERIPALWLETSLVATEAGMEYFRALRHHPKVSALAKRSSDVVELLDLGVQALREFADFLGNQLGPRAGGNIACGRRRFEMLLKLRHYLDINVDQLHALGTELLERVSRDLSRVCMALRGDDDISALARQIQTHRPQPQSLIESYRRQVRAARTFVKERGLVKFPPQESLTVVETPLFLRHEIPIAAYMEPAPSDPEQRGCYYVTPATAPDTLAEHNFATMTTTCVHEAYPGHHLQFVTANLSPVSSTLPRLLNASATLYEGWALYCEQMMREQGFLDRPEHEFVVLKDRLWRAMRVVIDVEMHARETAPADVKERMQQRLGIPEPHAAAELAWYSRAPTVPMAYATGWSLINAARDRRRAEDRGFDMRKFHDCILSCGSIAVPLVLKRVFGADFAERVRATVFGSPPDG